ncbi:hypothetical protein MHYP_G00176780 [Metynnis hypsauchen]
MKMSATEVARVLKEGELEKRSDNLLQFWRRKTCVLTTDSLNIYADQQKKNKSKELKLQSIKKVDCVERTGKFVYFTIVTTDNKEIDFRCSGEENCWNAAGHGDHDAAGHTNGQSPLIELLILRPARDVEKWSQKKAWTKVEAFLIHCLYV